MQGRVRIIAVVCVLVLIIILFAILYFQKQSAMNTLEEQYQEAMSYQQYLENKQNALQETLAALGTDSFVENLARTMYGYMKSDELRFVITNPDVLYGTQEVTEP